MSITAPAGASTKKSPRPSRTAAHPISRPQGHPACPKSASPSALGIMVLALAAWTIPALTGCRKGLADWEESSGAYRLGISPAPAGISLGDETGRILTTAKTIRFGRVTSWKAGTNYDPYLMVDDAINGPHEPEDFQWITVRSISSRTSVEGGSIYRMELSDGSQADLTVQPLPDAGFCMTFVTPDQTEQDGQPSWIYTSIDFDAPDGEQYYGLGGVFGSLAHRGHTVAMQMELSDAENRCNEAHVRIPFLVSSGGWALFLDTMKPGYLDVADSDPSRIRVVFAERNLRLCLLAASDPLDLTARYHAITAPPALPPIWSFAPIQWRNEVDGQEMVMQDATDIRRLHLPTGAIWIDRPYQSDYNTMDFDPHRFTDAQDMVASLHEWGFKVAGWNSPYLSETDPDHAMAESNGFFVQAGPGSPRFRRFGDLLDLTNPQAMTFWQDRVRDGIARGIEGFKLDYAEDIQLGISDARFTYSFFDGEDERTMNRHYATFYHRAYSEPLGYHDFFILARAGTIGGQEYASVLWPGDLDSNFYDWRHTDDQGTIHVGGLPVAVRLGISLSVSGFPFFASDTGGYKHGRPSSEVLVRWAEYSALMPIMQYGGGGANHNPWDFTDYGDSHYDEETLQDFTKYARLHIRLFPYFYSLALAATAYGKPVIRPFGLSYPTDGRHPDDVFLVGDDLLVAPVVRGGTSRTVPIPEGEWIDWWDGSLVTGPRDLTVAAPLGHLPLYIRRPAIVPMIRPTVETLTETTEEGIDSFWGSRPRVWGKIVPAPNSSQDFYLHDGSRLECDQDAAGKVTVTLSPGVIYSGLRITIYAPLVSTIQLDGEPMDEAASEHDLGTCAACFLREGPWVEVSVLDGDQEHLVVTLSAPSP